MVCLGERGRERRGEREGEGERGRGVGVVVSYHSSMGCHPPSKAQLCERRSDVVGHLLFSSLRRNFRTFFPQREDGMEHSCSCNT